MKEFIQFDANSISIGMRKTALFQLYFASKFCYVFFLLASNKKHEFSFQSNSKIGCTQKHNSDINDCEFVSFCSCWSWHSFSLADWKKLTAQILFLLDWWMPYVQIITLLLCSHPHQLMCFNAPTFNIMFFQCLFIFRYFCLC